MIFINPVFGSNENNSIELKNNYNIEKTHPEVLNSTNRENTSCENTGIIINNKTNNNINNNTSIYRTNNTG